MKLNRRQFVRTSAAAGIAAGVAAAASTPSASTPSVGPEQGPVMMTPKSIKPVVVSSSNGNKFKNGGTKTCVETAFSMIVGGRDVLDALIAGVNIVELDPLDDSVGYGGLPNAEGVVQLDSCCMHGPKRRAGGVAEIEGVRTPSIVAQMVMDLTDHHLIVGKGAQDFARNMGMTIETDLNTENSRKKWLEWKRRTDPLHYLSPKDREQAYRQVARDMIAEGLIDREHYYGTINCDGISAKGEIEEPQALNMTHSKALAADRHLFVGRIDCRTSGRQGYAIRILPGSKDMATPFEPGLIIWN